MRQAAESQQFSVLYAETMIFKRDVSQLMELISEKLKFSLFISSRILQEMGSGTSLYNLYSGIYEGFAGFYNFYNFGVTDECATSKGIS